MRGLMTCMIQQDYDMKTEGANPLQDGKQHMDQGVTSQDNCQKRAKQRHFRHEKQSVFATLITFLKAVLKKVIQQNKSSGDLRSLDDSTKTFITQRMLMYNIFQFLTTKHIYQNWKSPISLPLFMTMVRNKSGEEGWASL